MIIFNTLHVFCVTELQQLIVQETQYINSVVHYVLIHVIQLEVKSVMVDVLKDVSVPVKCLHHLDIVLVNQIVKVSTLMYVQ